MPNDALVKELLEDANILRQDGDGVNWGPLIKRLERAAKALSQPDRGGERVTDAMVVRFATTLWGPNWLKHASPVELRFALGAALSTPSVSAPGDEGRIVVHLERREDDGLRVSSPTNPGLILSGVDPLKVCAAIWPALEALRQHKAAPSPVVGAGVTDAAAMSVSEPSVCSACNGTGDADNAAEDECRDCSGTGKPNADVVRETAVRLIQQERDRQIAVEGWTPEHDDEHADGEMLRAAVIYLHHDTDRAAPMNGNIPLSWPWDAKWWKPKDRVRNLERAGALCLAEKDRLERMGNVFQRAPRSVQHVEQKLGLVVAALTEAMSTPPAPQAVLGEGFSFDDWFATLTRGKQQERFSHSYFMREAWNAAMQALQRRIVPMGSGE